MRMTGISREKNELALAKDMVMRVKGTEEIVTVERCAVEIGGIVFPSYQSVIVRRKNGYRYPIDVDDLMPIDS